MAPDLGGRTIGTVPIVNVLGIGSLVGFAGRRWRVVAVDDRAMVLDVVPHRAGKLPKFDRPASEALDDRLVETIQAVFEDDDRPAYLDSAAQEFLDQGRAVYRELGLGHRSMVVAGNDTHLLTWAGTAVNDLLGILLTSAGLDAEVHDFGVTAVETMPAELAALPSKVEECPPIENLAGFVQGLRTANRSS